MVKTLFCIAMLYVSFLSAFEVTLPPKMSVQILQAIAQQKIIGRITIIHTEDQKVDLSSFTMNGMPLSVQFENEEQPAYGASSQPGYSLVVSHYRFTLPPRAGGLYLLPAIQARVGNFAAVGPQLSFEVVTPMVSQDLRLQARIVQEGAIYPGQKITFEYRIFFRESVELFEEKLPLLQFNGFQNVGAPRIQNEIVNNENVQIISQDAIAQGSGMFSSGASEIEGFPYSTDASGNRVYGRTPLLATAPAISVTVAPFPKAGRPASFNGSIGVFTIRDRIVGPPEVNVGEKIEVRITVIGSGEFDTVTLPDLAAQPGFRDAFQFSSIPPPGKMVQGAKEFSIGLIPLIPVKAIPPIEFASFDPLSKTYIVKKTDPIPIRVRQVAGASVSASGGALPLEIAGNVMIDQSDKETHVLDALLLLYFALTLAAILGVQVLLHWLVSKKKSREKKSREIILEAIKVGQKPDVLCPLLKKALLLALYETHATPTLVQDPEVLSKDGLQGEVRSFLLSIDQKRFDGLEAGMATKELIAQASELYHRITKLASTPRRPS